MLCWNLLTQMHYFVCYISLLLVEYGGREREREERKERKGERKGGREEGEIVHIEQGSSIGAFHIIHC